MTRRGEGEQDEGEGDDVDVKPIPGLEHLPYAEAWFHEIDDTRWAEASTAAHALGKTGLEAWTTTRTPDVAEFLKAHGYEEVRRYVISELDVASAPEPDAPAFEIVTIDRRPDLVLPLYGLALQGYPDQPGRAESKIDASWFEWGLRAHPPEAFFVALEEGQVLGFGNLERDGDEWRNGFLAVTREARGRGVGSALKAAQIRWAKANGVVKLTTANEVRLAGMLALNRRLGYVPVYEEIVLRGPLAP
jgi:GNAT superfamily N-acetyltransferase